MVSIEMLDEGDGEVVDYAAAADAYASDEDDFDGGDEYVGEDGHFAGMALLVDGSEEDESGDEVDDEDEYVEVSFIHDDDDEEEEEEDSVVGVEDEEDEDDTEDMTEEGEEPDDEGDEGAEQYDDEKQAPRKFVPPTSATGEQCTFDLRNLLALNSHQIKTSDLYSREVKGSLSAEAENNLLPLQKLDVAINEKYLQDKATDGCAQIIHALWQLPRERSDAGTMIILPTRDQSNVPREKPPPPPKKETKWEKFAKERGISVNKTKRSRKVWDEATGTWMYRHGYEKANDKSKEWPIMEVKGNEDPYADPWERVRDEKRKRTEKNLESRLRNKERAGELAKGTTNRVLKSREKIRTAGKAGGNLDRENVSLPVGVPVDLHATRDGLTLQSTKRGKDSTVKALQAVQRSTASMGKFDKMREGEPERKKAASAAKKRKLESPTDKNVLNSETGRSLKVLKSVIEGGGAQKERDIRKGRLANGETAYDYDFDDGLGPSSFRKKKGRAGAGKARKMTKKRSKQH